MSKIPLQKVFRAFHLCIIHELYVKENLFDRKFSSIAVLHLREEQEIVAQGKCLQVSMFEITSPYKKNLNMIGQFIQCIPK